MRILLAVILLGLAVSGCTPQGAPSRSRPLPAQTLSTTRPRPPQSSQFSELPDLAPSVTAPATAHATSHSAPNLIVTPETGLKGQVKRVNTAGRFVLLSFPVGHLPVSEQHLIVYREGLKVGEVKVNDLRNDDTVVADVIVGDASEGDEVRDR
jgi:hypothetical protein